MTTEAACRNEEPMTINVRRTLLSDTWTAEVKALETAVARFTADRRLTHDCDIALFEMVGDRHLHVNVTHSHSTKSVRGWAGPGRVRGGFVHNRRFDQARRSQIIRHVREIVLAPRIDEPAH